MSEKTHLLPAGKLPLPLLEKFLTRFAPHDPRIVVGPRAGEDAAVFDLGDRYLVAKTDPITFATSEIGWYAVNVNANDVAVMGARPRWFLATVLLPAGQVTAGMAEAIFAQIYDACQALGVSLAGGHTEITVNLDRPIISGVMLGEVAPDRLIRTSGARVGDEVLLVKPVPIEGTALIALERAEILAARGYSADFIARAQQFLHDPGISVVAPALLAAETAEVHAMHDPTEGGVMTGLLEIARAAGTGLTVDLDAIPVLAEGAALCREFGLDPLGTLASGAILLVAPPAAAGQLVAVLEGAGYPTARIGRITPAEAGLVARRAGERVAWPIFAADEITKIFT
ncbi:MAG: hydrogenase expression/formation protein [Chloroflexi bacterium HGW-Chloroflexi-1]|nr:MAG: hydrogenase expression/formation protein [Chloroflexi bacterium HGW-Chloroflexi-1]